MRLGLFFNEGRRRKLSPLWSKIVGVLVVLFAAVELYGAPFGFIDSFILRSVFVSFAITLTFICYTPIRTEPGQSENVPVPDILLACISLAAGAYMVLNGAELVTRWTGVDPLTPADWAVTAAFVLLTLEVTRRTVGPVLLGIILVFIVYNFVGEYLPGYFGHRGSTMEVFLDRMVYTYDGIFGTPVGVMLAEHTYRAIRFQLRERQSHHERHGSVAPYADVCSRGYRSNCFELAQCLTANAHQFSKDVGPGRFTGDGQQLTPVQAHDFLTETVRIAGAEECSSLIVAVISGRVHASGQKDAKCTGSKFSGRIAEDFAHSFVKQGQRQFLGQNFRRAITLEVALIRRAYGQIARANQHILRAWVFHNKARQKKTGPYQSDDLFNHGRHPAEMRQYGGRTPW